MKCPHCSQGFHDQPAYYSICKDNNDDWVISSRTCPECKKPIFILHNGTACYVSKTMGQRYCSGVVREKNNYLVYPKGIIRPCPKEVSDKYADDFKEACLVLSDSPKASAALSRRCLQDLLRDVAKVKPGILSKEIKEFINRKGTPTHIADALDAVRNIGNFATHPIKDKHTGEVLPVEPGEAEWNLDVIESLFDFLFVQPAKLKKKREALNEKLAKAGKPMMEKKPTTTKVSK